MFKVLLTRQVISRFFVFVLPIVMIGVSITAFGAERLPIPPIPGIEDNQNVSMLLQIIYMMTFLSLVPAIVVLMTSFTRIVIVFGFLRTAMGVQSAPSNAVIIALALALTFFIMRPTFEKVNDTALAPYIAEQIQFKEAIRLAVIPMRDFMLSNTRSTDLNMFVEISGERPRTIADVSLVTLMCAFVTSELRTAFEIGFLLYLPFLVIDFAVSSILLAMGMMMLPPAMVSMPFKIMLFVLVDGWDLIIGSLIQTFKG